MVEVALHRFTTWNDCAFQKLRISRFKQLFSCVLSILFRFSLCLAVSGIGFANLVQIGGKYERKEGTSGEFIFELAFKPTLCVGVHLKQFSSLTQKKRGKSC